ncbi:hypothetical protein J2T12_001429 [Paenibacillus anaericanus]|nr:hypothetical protein [Paenibacillus anaericanus]
MNYYLHKDYRLILDINRNHCLLIEEDHSGEDGIVLKKRSVRLCLRIYTAIAIDQINLEATAIVRIIRPRSAYQSTSSSIFIVES